MIFCRLVVLFSLLCPMLALGQASTVADGVLINADSMFRDLEKRVVRLKGNVQLAFKGQHVSCDSAEIDLRKQMVTAKGKVILSSETAHAEADQLVFNYRKNTGHLYNGFVQSGQVVFQGDVIEKYDENRYLASNAQFTSCETCPPGWSFSGSRIDAEFGGYARIRRPVFRIAGVPILLLPGIIVPLKSARQSGLLVPTQEYSKKGGIGIGQSYFWAIDRSRDLTFTAKWYKERGYKVHTDYRYVLSEKSSGQLESAWIRDNVFKQDNSLNNDFDRWFVKYHHLHDLPNNYVHRLDLNTVSDLHYPRDFTKELKGHKEPSLENSMSVTKSSDDHYFSAETTLYTNLLKEHPLSTNDDAVHRFPEIRYSLKDRRIGGEWGPFAHLNINYVNFGRFRHNYDDLALDGTSGLLKPIGLGSRGEIVRDGVFDPATDIFRTGQRLDIRPSISYPFQIARLFDILPAISFRETQYRFYPTDSAEAAGFSPSAARRYAQADLAVRTEFSRVFGSQEPQANRWKHTLEPELSYSHIPWLKRPDHPFFGSFTGQQFSRQYEAITDLDLVNPNAKLQFDYEDRTYERQVVNFAINNRLNRKVWRNGVPEYKTAVLFNLSQSYDFNEARSSTPHPWSSIHSLLNMRFDHFETYTTAAYNPYAKVTNLSSRVKVLVNPKNYLQVAYTRNFTLTDEAVVDTETRNVSFGAGINTKYLGAEGQIDLAARTWQVQSWKYLVNIRPPGRCWSFIVGHTLEAGTDDIRTDFSFNFEFGGEKPPTQKL